MMKPISIAIVVVTTLAACGAALGDELTAGGIKETSLRVEDVREGALQYRRARGGQSASMPLANITNLKIDKFRTFNQAEDLMRSGEMDAAIQTYNRAKVEAATAWQKRLVRYRMLVLLGKARRIDAWTAEWLAIVADEGPAEAVLALTPGELPAKGSQASGLAIRQLEGKLPAVEDEAFATAIRSLLLDLYKQEGLQEKAVAMARRLRAAASKPAPEPSRPKTLPPPGTLGGANRLKYLRKSLDVEPDKVLQEIDPRAYSYAELPEALLLRGKAQMLVAGKAGGADKRRRLLAAGLDFMRVRVFFGKTPHAAEALYLAGSVNEQIGNTRAAGIAYQQVVRQYPRSAFASKAKAQLSKRNP